VSDNYVLKRDAVKNFVRRHAKNARRKRTYRRRRNRNYRRKRDESLLRTEVHKKTTHSTAKISCLFCGNAVPSSELHAVGLLAHLYLRLRFKFFD
jgi:hypothetical protein